MSTPEFGFCKAERLCSKKRIEQLFESGSQSLSAFPLRAVFRTVEREGMPVEVLISVSKRHFKHAVDRNRVKRLVREAFRHHKHLLWQALDDTKLDLAFLWQSNEIPTYSVVEKKIVNLLQRIAEKITPPHPSPTREGEEWSPLVNQK